MEKYWLNWAPEPFWDNNFLDTLEPWIRENWSRLSFVIVPKHLLVALERPRRSTLMSYAKEIEEGYWLIGAQDQSETVKDEVLGFLQFSGYSALWVLFRDEQTLNSFRDLYYACSETKHREYDSEAVQLLNLTGSIAAFTSGDESTDGFLYVKSAGEEKVNQISPQFEGSTSRYEHPQKFITNCIFLFVLIFGGGAAQIALWKNADRGYVAALLHSPALWLFYFLISRFLANGIVTSLERRDKG
jgi:hypothetical protein